MAIEGYETSILVGMILLVVWYNSLPYDNTAFTAWDNRESNPPIVANHLQKPSMTRLPETTDPYNIGIIVEEISKIVVYFVVPFIILYKMFLITIRELRFKIWY